MVVPDDWMERSGNSRFSWQSAGLMLSHQPDSFGAAWRIYLGGANGLDSVHAAGIINGIGHYSRVIDITPSTTPAKRTPIAFWIGGEEHNNHHAFPGFSTLLHALV
jgi:stearoyl-CoA desaturase (delta-9 desaturase)